MGQSSSVFHLGGLAFAALLHFSLGSAQPVFWLYALLTIHLTILITWVYHGSGDSLFLVMLFHALPSIPGLGPSKSAL
jgi:membrane protease YdiL (CAAX protease family)